MATVLLNILILLAALAAMMGGEWFSHKHNMRESFYRYLDREGGKDFGRLWLSYRYFQEQKSGK